MTTGKNGGSSRFLSAIASRLGIREIDVFREGPDQVREYRGLGMRFRRKVAGIPVPPTDPVAELPSPPANGHNSGHSESLNSLASQLAATANEPTSHSGFEVRSRPLVFAAHAGSATAPVPVASSDAVEVQHTMAFWEPPLELLSETRPPVTIVEEPSEKPLPAQPERPANGRHPMLSGKTVAVVGFSAQDAALLGSSLAAQYCSFLILSHEEAEFKKGSTSGCDLLMMQARPEWGEPGVLYPGSALKTKRPALIIGNREALSAVALWTHGGPREFVPAPWIAEDIIWQAATQLVRMEASKVRRGKKTGRKLVIIGDADTAASTLLHAVLAQEGIGCHVAENGVNALALAKSKQADAVIVDVSLPGLDGFQVLAELKRDPAMSHTVIILLTARQAEADVLRGFGLGADDYITKPFSPMEVVARLKRFLLRKP